MNISGIGLNWDSAKRSSTNTIESDVHKVTIGIAQEKFIDVMAKELANYTKDSAQRKEF